MEPDTYLTVREFSQGLYKEKGSRFLSFAYPVFSTDEIKGIIEKIVKEHHGAKHHCYAYVLGEMRQTWRVSDDGEPSGTAGRPILGQINSFGLTNILIVVSRYFGGKLLGASGLINAYRSSAESAIANGKIVELTVRDYYELYFPYVSLNEVMRIIKDLNIDHSVQKLEKGFSISINFRKSMQEQILALFDRIEGLKYKYLNTH